MQPRRPRQPEAVRAESSSGRRDFRAKWLSAETKDAETKDAGGGTPGVRPYPVSIPCDPGGPT